MAQVISLHGDTLPGEPEADVVETLERLLAEAKAGAIVGIAYAVDLGQGGTATGWDGAARSRHPLGTAIMMLHSRYASGLMEG